MRQSNISLLFGLSIVFFGVGCTGQVDAPQSLGHASGETSAATISRTIVTFNKDGTHTSRFDMITVDEQKSEQAGRVEYLAALRAGRTPMTAELYQDPYCALADFVAYDQTGFTGNEICFYNQGSTVDVADLANYYRSVCGAPPFSFPCYPWFSSGTNVIKSYSIGSQGACFNASSSSTYGSPSYLNMYYAGCCGGSSVWPGTSTENYYVSNPGSYYSDYSSLEYLWLDYGTYDTYNVCYYP